jgi:hypothetical protein
MTHRKLIASTFVVSDLKAVRVRTDGFVIGLHKAPSRNAEAARAMLHAVNSARLEGITVRPDFIANLFERRNREQDGNDRSRGM